MISQFMSCFPQETFKSVQAGDATELHKSFKVRGSSAPAAADEALALGALVQGEGHHRALQHLLRLLLCQSWLRILHKGSQVSEALQACYITFMQQALHRTHLEGYSLWETCHRLVVSNKAGSRQQQLLRTATQGAKQCLQGKGQLSAEIYTCRCSLPSENRGAPLL